MKSTSSFCFSSSFFSFSARLSRSLSSKENGQTSTWRFSGRRGWKGRPKWGTLETLTGEGSFTWRTGSRQQTEGEAQRLTEGQQDDSCLFSPGLPVDPLLEGEGRGFWDGGKLNLLLR